MSDSGQTLPSRLEPYLGMTEVNQPVHVAPKPLKLVGGGDSVELDSELTFQWAPTVGVVFAGDCPGQWLDISADWAVELAGAQADRVPCSLTNMTVRSEGSHVRGALNGELAIGADGFQVLRFCLTNFPSYLGSPVHTDTSGSWARCRIAADSALGTLTVDEIEGAETLRKEAEQRRGFAVTHVGEWVPGKKEMSAEDARDTLRMLHFWFGLLRGAWCGPVFAQGISEGEVAWRHYARWRLAEAKGQRSWLPHATPVDLQNTFTGFVTRWKNPAWQGPLVSAIAWLVEANDTRALESKIVLAQVALELLAWVWLVETQQLHSRGDFGRLSAAGKIRALLHHARVPVALPAYMPSLAPLVNGDAFDGPGVATMVRNALVHAHEHNRAKAVALSGQQLAECADLSLQYVELVLLAICGHSGHYARRGWKGWQGDDEVVVPWAG